MLNNYNKPDWYWRKWGGRVVSVTVLLSAAILLSACNKQAGTALPLSSRTFEGVQPNTPLSFEVEQVPGQNLLIVVTGHEAEFDARVYESSDEDLTTGKTWYLRLVPLYFLMDETTSARSLTIEINPLHATVNSSLTVEVFSLPVETRADMEVISAYRLYQGAMESTTSEAKEDWQPRVAGLLKAADLFEGVGAQEQSLWSRILAANFTYYPIYDNPTAISLARQTYKNALDKGFPKIALLSLSTEAQALMERDALDSLEETLRKQRLAQEKFDQVYQLAVDTGIAFEQAWALNNKGIGYYYLDEHEAAVDWYQQALDSSKVLNDSYFTNLVVGNMALAQEKLGDFASLLEILNSINRDLRVGNETNQLIHNLTSIGRLHRMLFQFPESIEVLDEAQDLAEQTNDAEALGRIGLWLALAYQSMGNLERADTILQDAILKMESVNNGRLLREAHQVAANIARRKGEYESVRSHRESQKKFSSSDANHATYFYDRGLDGLHAGAGDAEEFFQEALKRYTDAGFEQMIWMSQLHLCAIAVGTAAEGQCDMDATYRALDSVKLHSMPYRQLEARYVWAGILKNNGKHEEAFVVLDELISDLAFYRQNLPGVLGAWYWSSRNQVFGDFLDLSIQRDRDKGSGIDSLVTLDRLRGIGRKTSSKALSSAESDQLRTLLAQRDQAGEGEAEQLEQEIDRVFLATGKVSDVAHQVDAEAFKDTLQKIPEDSGLLAYHISVSGSWVWLVTREGVKLYALTDHEAIEEALNETRANFRVIGYSGLEADLDLLGDLLLEGIVSELPEKLYLLSGGQLSGFPFDALRQDGRYLVEDHAVVNLMSLAGLGNAIQNEGTALQVGKIFLAGNPQVANSSIPELRATSAELENIVGLFPDSEIHVAQASELALDDFQSEAFLKAELIHIATHGQIDIRYPELSRLSLSTNNEEGKFLTPRDLGSQNLAAQLVVLSACDTIGSNDFSWDSNLGFVSAIASGGQTSVIASLWPLGDQFAERFFEEFYKKTTEGLSPSAALIRTKRHLILSSSLDISQATSVQLITD